MPFVDPESARKQLAVSSNLFAYWLFHAITFERKFFFENPRVEIQEKPKRNPRVLLVPGMYGR